MIAPSAEAGAAAAAAPGARAAAAADAATAAAGLVIPPRHWRKRPLRLWWRLLPAHLSHGMGGLSDANLPVSGTRDKDSPSGLEAQ